MTVIKKMFGSDGGLVLAYDVITNCVGYDFGTAIIDCLFDGLRITGVIIRIYQIVAIFIVTL